MAQPINYDLSTNISVESSNFETDADLTLNGSTKVAKGTKTSVIEDKKGLFYAGENGEYSFTALFGGNFKFKDNEAKAAITSFDASAANSAVEIAVDNTDGNKKLKNIVTGSGKDLVSVTSASGATFDLGAGNDSISVAAGTATVTLGDGKDTINIADADGTSVKIADYSYADDTVILAGADASKLKMEYDKSMFTAQGASTKASIGTTMNNGVYELKLSDGTNATHFVRTNVSSVDYVAKDAIDFASTEDTTALKLTLADKTVNKVSVGATSGTVNIVAGKAGTVPATTSISVGAADVELGLSISKKSGEFALTVGGAAGKLDENDTLYLVDGGKLDELKFNSGNLEYAAAGAPVTAKVTNAYNNAAEGAFNCNINGNTGVLRYGDGDKVTYTKGVSYYANAVSVDAADYGEVVLNLNGDSDNAFAAGINTIDNVTSGWVVGRNNKETTINLATEANKKTEVYGGVGGNDAIKFTNADEESTNVIWYSNGDGKDDVTGFQKGNNSIYFHDATATASVLNNVLTMNGNKMTLTLTKGKDELSLDNTSNKTIDFKDAAGNNFKVAVGDGTTVDYAAGVNIYKGATTLKVSGSDDLILYTGANNDQFGYFDGINKIDATDAKGTLALSGNNVNGMEIHGGTGVNNMWGGGNKVQTMYGNEDAAVNVFWFGNTDGRDTAKNAKAEDGVYLYDVEKIDDVTVKASTNYFTVNVGNNALKVEVGAADATTVLEKFTFADKAGVLYTYNTETKKFQQK